MRAGGLLCVVARSSVFSDLRKGCRRLEAHPGGTREVRAESRGHRLEASETHHLERIHHLEVREEHLLAGKGMELPVMVQLLACLGFRHLLMELVRSHHQAHIKEILQLLQSWI